MRHSLEHYYSILDSLTTNKSIKNAAVIIDYDNRPRNLEIETDRSVALRAINDISEGIHDISLVSPVTISLIGKMNKSSNAY